MKKQESEREDFSDVFEGEIVSILQERATTFEQGDVILFHKKKCVKLDDHRNIFIVEISDILAVQNGSGLMGAIRTFAR